MTSPVGPGSSGTSTLSLRPLTRLLLRHGIALEAHTQNSLVALDDGWPARFVVRDLEGVSLNRDAPRRPVSGSGR